MALTDQSAAIAQIEAILNTGAKTVTVDGVTTTYDIEALRARLRELKDLQEKFLHQNDPEPDLQNRSRRPVSVKVNLWGF